MVGCSFGQHGDHRIAPGDRMVGEEDQRPARPRAPGRHRGAGPRLGSSSSIRRARAGPSSLTATRLASTETVQRVTEQGCPGLVGEPVPARAGSQLEPLCRLVRRRELDARHPGSGPTDLEPGAGSQRSRAKAGQHVGRAAAEGLRHLKPTSYGEVVADTRAAADRPAARYRAGAAIGVCDAVGLPPTSSWVGAPVTAIQASRSTMITKPPIVISITAAPSGLPTRRLASAQAVRSAAPEGDTPRWARPGRPRSSISASGPVSETMIIPIPPRRTGPGCLAAAGQAGLDQDPTTVAEVRPINCQPPGPDRG